MSRSAVAVWSLVVWTLFVWLSRLRNIWADDALSTVGQTGRSLLALSFVALAAWVILRRSPRSVGGLALWTTIVWIVRGFSIAFADHSAGFIAIHTALAVVSIALAAWAWSATGGYHRRRHGPADHRRRKAVNP